MITFILELMFFFGAVVLLVLGVNAYLAWSATRKKRERADQLSREWDANHRAPTKLDTQP